MTHALLNAQGWWTEGPTGYLGPHEGLPPSRRPRRVGLVGVTTLTLTVPPGALEREIEAAVGAKNLVVADNLGRFRVQCYTTGPDALERVEQGDPPDLIAPYPLAVLAALHQVAPDTTRGPVVVVERLGSALLITVAEGRQVLTYRDVEIEPGDEAPEIYRTLLGLRGEFHEAIHLFAPTELAVPPEWPDAQVHPLPRPCLGLVGLGRLGRPDGFVTLRSAQAAYQTQTRHRRRQRVQLTLALGAAALLVWASGAEVRQAQQARLRAATLELAQLETERATLAALRLRPSLVPWRLTPAGGLLGVLSEAAGLVEARFDRHTIQLRVAPPDPALFGPHEVAALVTAVPEAHDIKVHPVTGRAGEQNWSWQITARLGSPEPVSLPPFAARDPSRPRRQ